MYHTREKSGLSRLTELGESVIRAGRERFILSDWLPVSAQGYHYSETDQILRAWGVEIPGTVSSDAIFSEAHLPPGWRKVADPNNLYWTNVLDNDGRLRLCCMVNSIPGEACAKNQIMPRFWIDHDFSETKQGYRTARIHDCERILHQVRVKTPQIDADHLYPDSVEAAQWLDHHFPEWRNPYKSWGAPIQSSTGT